MCTPIYVLISTDYSAAKRNASINIPSSTKKPRGRPREFNKETALAAASGLFREQGYAGTSIDSLAEAMGISKPSLYGTYGDKAQLFLLALEAFAGRMAAMAEQTLDGEDSLKTAIGSYLNCVLDIYYEGDDQGLGCLVMMTAAIEATTQPAVREFLAEVLARADEAVARRIQRERGVSKGKPSQSDMALARLVTGIMVSLSTRARAGESRQQLGKIVASTAQMVSRGL
jgi:AcrR family transcriptional regulator